MAARSRNMSGDTAILVIVMALVAVEVLIGGMPLGQAVSLGVAVLVVYAAIKYWRQIGCAALVLVILGLVYLWLKMSGYQ